jgi:hypothetical protein
LTDHQPGASDLQVSPTPSDRPGASFLRTRRALLGYGLSVAALWGLRPFRAIAAQEARTPGPAEWRTWLLASANELRPDPPGWPGRAEVHEILHLQAQRTATMEDAVTRWGTGSAVLPWTDLALELIKTHRPSPVRAGRALALLHVAVYDAVVAAWDAQAAYARRAPSVAEARIEPLVAVDPDHSTLLSEHAAVAGAASVVLAYLFPNESAERLNALAAETAESRVWAGTRGPAQTSR